MTVMWAVCSGEYSDFSIEFLVPTEEMANAICSAGRGPYERYYAREYDVIDELPEPALSAKLGCAVMADGTIIELEPVELKWYPGLPYYAAPHASVSVRPLIDILKPVLVTPEGREYEASNDFEHDPRGELHWRIEQRIVGPPSYYYSHQQWRWTVAGIEIEVQGPELERVRKVYSDRKAEVLAMIGPLTQPGMWSDDERGGPKFFRPDTLPGKLNAWPES